MLKNYITIAINNLLKNKLYSAINIVGLAVGLTVCLLITLYVQGELSYDKHWKKADRIFRINLMIGSGDSPAMISQAISPLELPALKKYFSEDIEFGTRIQRIGGTVKIGVAEFPNSFHRVDEDFIDIFQFEVLQGSLQDTLKNPHNIALSEESAKKYFGDRDPIGESLTFIPDYGAIQMYNVTAVYQHISPNTVLNVQSFSLLNEAEIQPAWNVIGYETFIRFNETADIEKFTSRLPDFVNQIVPATLEHLEPDQKLSAVRRYPLQKISDIYFNPISSPFFPQTKTGNMTVIFVFIIISLLVLLIACVNFVILSTAKATQRAREIAMRKVVGARFKQLIFQFLGESVLLTVFSFLMAVAMIEITLPLFEMIVGKDYSVPYLSPGSYLFVLLLLIAVGILGGFYPALVLSRFSPARALRANQTIEADVSFRLRNILVVFQFTASIILIIAMSVTFFQLQYTRNHDPGFNPDNLLVVEGINRPPIQNSIHTLQQELLSLPSVNNICLSTLQPKWIGFGVIISSNPRLKTEVAIQDAEMNLNSMFVDYNFFNTYEISLLSGRYFTKDIDQEERSPLNATPSKKNRTIHNRKVIINSAAARNFGFTSPDEAIGRILVEQDPGSSESFEFSIIGVVEDTQYRGLRQKPIPEMYHLSPDAAIFLTVRYRGDYQAVLKEIRRVWYNVVGDQSFLVSNVRQNLAGTFSQEETENNVLIAFASLSVFIACMGLFGMASFTVDRRVKEIGLRKVMGARARDIVKLLSWQFLKPVLIANIIAWPVAIYAVQSWLERFPYRFNPLYMIPICLCAGLIAFIISWLTVAGNTTRAARKNPIQSLRYE